MKHLLLLLILLLPATLCAQSVDHTQRPQHNEVGLRYGIDIGVAGPNQATQHKVSLDYIRYSRHDIGFKTGVEYYITGERLTHGIGLPLHFSWRTGRLGRKHDTGYYYNHEYYPPTDPVMQNESLGWALASMLMPAPSIFELHGGITPSWQRGLANGNTIGGIALSADVGGRLMFPIKRFRIVVDVTYRYFLPTGFVQWVMSERSQRSVISIGAGIAYNF